MSIQVLGDVLAKSSNWIVLDPEARYRQVTVKLWGKGVELRGEVLGGEVGSSRQLRLRGGQFLISRIDARHGASGLVPASLDGAIATNDFPAFTIDAGRVDAGYFDWLSKTDQFVAVCKRANEGTTNRVRLKEDRFLAETIDLPSLDHQRQIARRLYEIAAHVEQRRRTEAAAQEDLRSLLFAAFEQMTAGAPLRPMSELAPIIRRQVKIDPEGSYPELGVRSFGRGTFHKPALGGNEVGSKKLFAIQSGDLLFMNIFAWEGAIAVAQDADAGRVGSHRFITCVANPELTTADFLRYYLLTNEGLEKIGLASPGGAGRNRTLGINALMRITVPIPSMAKQQWFDRLQAKVREVRALQASAEAELDALIPAALNRVFARAA